MKIKDWCIVCKTLGKQLALEIFFGVWSASLFFLSDILLWIAPVFALIVKGSAGFLAAYYFTYCILLTKKIIDKNFK
jgi:hypothetical protein